MSYMISKLLNLKRGYTVSVPVEHYTELPAAARQLSEIAADMNDRCPGCWIERGELHRPGCSYGPAGSPGA